MSCLDVVVERRGFGTETRGLREAPILCFSCCTVFCVWLGFGECIGVARVGGDVILRESETAGVGTLGGVSP